MFKIFAGGSKMIILVEPTFKLFKRLNILSNTLFIMSGMFLLSGVVGLFYLNHVTNGKVREQANTIAHLQDTGPITVHTAVTDTIINHDTVLITQNIYTENKEKLNLLQRQIFELQNKNFQCYTMVTGKDSVINKMKNTLNAIDNKLSIYHNQLAIQNIKNEQLNVLINQQKDSIANLNKLYDSCKRRKR